MSDSVYEEVNEIQPKRQKKNLLETAKSKAQMEMMKNIIESKLASKNQEESEKQLFDLSLFKKDEEDEKNVNEKWDKCFNTNVSS